MKKVIIILVVIIIGLLGYVYYQAQNSQHSQTVPLEIVDEGEQPLVDSESKESIVLGEDTVYQEETESYTIKATSPTLTSGNAIIQRNIEDYTRAQIERFKEFTADYPSDFDQRYALELEYTIMSSDTIYTIIMRGYEFTGGAHPNSFLKTFSYSQETGERLMIEDLISNREVLYTLAALADKELIVDYPEGSSGERIDNWEDFYADNTHITFIFSPYQIAPYAVGEQEFTVRAAGQAELFKQEYFNSL